MPSKQKSGLYRAKVRLGDKDGKPVYKYISGKTKAELEKARREIIEVYVEGRYASKRLLFGEYVVQWSKSRMIGSPSTIRLNKSLINNHILPYLELHTMRSITSIDLQDALNTLAENTTLGKSTISSIKRIMCHIFRDAYADRIIDHDPSTRLIVPVARERKILKRPLTAEERIMYLRYADEHPNIKTMLYILYYTGVRIGEAAGFQWSDINWSKRIITVNRDIDDSTHLPSTPKNKNAYRSIPIPPQLYNHLQANRGMPTAYLITGRFGGQTYPTAMRAKFNAAMRELGMYDITPHCIRHNYISMCYESGIDCGVVTRVVGHASYAITQDVYTHLSETIKQKTDQQIVAMFK